MIQSTLGFPMILALIVLLSANTCCTADAPRIDSSDMKLWNTTVHRLLQDSLWQQRDAYDAGHFLMVPLHAAFASNHGPWMKDFHNFFQRFLDFHAHDDFDSLGKLTRLQFMYLGSQYLILANKSSVPAPEGLQTLLLESLDKIWHQPAWQWRVCGAGSEFPDGMVQRINWKLTHKKVTQSYCRAIIDEEWFSFSISADLKSILGQRSPTFIDDSLSLAYQVLSREVAFESDHSGKWILQPGGWSDHPDYAYAGWSRKVKGLEKKPVPGIAPDTSHFHRMPLWLLSLQRAFELEGDHSKAVYITQLRNGLAAQFLEEVLVPPSEGFPNYRMYNYMNGHNGLFRYKYVTQRERLGYGPYELSGTMLLSWWTFLPADRVQTIYSEIASSFPLSSEEIAVYLGPDTSRDRHPLIKGTAQFQDGLLELITRLACTLEKQ